MGRWSKCASNQKNPQQNTTTNRRPNGNAEHFFRKFDIDIPEEIISPESEAIVRKNSL
jgi:hypothetical protein